MTGKNDSTPDRTGLSRRLRTRQYGVVASRQLRELGLSGSGDCEERLRTGPAPRACTRGVHSCVGHRSLPARGVLDGGRSGRVGAARPCRTGAQPLSGRCARAGRRAVDVTVPSNGGRHATTGDQGARAHAGCRDAGRDRSSSAFRSRPSRRTLLDLADVAPAARAQAERSPEGGLPRALRPHRRPSRGPRQPGPARRRAAAGRSARAAAANPLRPRGPVPRR